MLPFLLELSTGGLCVGSCFRDEDECKCSEGAVGVEARLLKIELGEDKVKEISGQMEAAVKRLSKGRMVKIYVYIYY